MVSPKPIGIRLPVVANSAVEAAAGGAASPSVAPVTPSTAICGGLPVARGPAHPLRHGHQITRDDMETSLRFFLTPKQLPAGTIAVGAENVRAENPAHLAAAETTPERKFWDARFWSGLARVPRQESSHHPLCAF